MWNWIWIPDELCISGIAHKSWLNCVWFLVLTPFSSLPKRMPAWASGFPLLPSVFCILHSWPWFYEFHNVFAIRPFIAFIVRRQRCKGDRIRILMTLWMRALCCQFHQVVAWSCWGWSHSLASLPLWMVMWVRVELVTRPPNRAHGIFNERRIYKKMKQSISTSVSKGKLPPKVKGAHWAISLKMKLIIANRQWKFILD